MALINNDCERSFAPGASPSYGAEENGLLASLNSVAKIPYHWALDGISNTQTINPDALGHEKEERKTNLVQILDIKEMDSEKHRKLTGHGNENILALGKYLSDQGKEMWIRHVMVPGVTDDPEGLRNLRDYLNTLKTVTRTETLPYHTMGVFKWENLGIPYPLEGVPTPTKEQIAAAEAILLKDQYDDCQRRCPGDNSRRARPRQRKFA